MKLFKWIEWFVFFGEPFKWVEWFVFLVRSFDLFEWFVFLVWSFKWLEKKNLVIQQKLNQKSILSVEKNGYCRNFIELRHISNFQRKIDTSRTLRDSTNISKSEGYPNSEIFWWSHGDQNNIQFSKKNFEVLDFCKNWSRSNLYLIFRNFDICLNSWRSEQYLNIEKNFWGFGFCINWSRLNQYLMMWNWDICLNSLRSEQYPKIGKKIEFGMTDWNSRDQNNIWFSNFEVLMWSHWRQKHIWWS